MLSLSRIYEPMILTPVLDFKCENAYGYAVQGTSFPLSFPFRIKRSGFSQG